MINIDLKDIGDIAKNIEEMAGFYKLEADVHRYTPAIGNYYRSCFNQIDNKYQFSKPGNLQETVDEILDYCQNEPNVKSALSTIQGAAGRIEPETGIDVAELLVKTWQLGKQSHYSNAQDVMIDNLKHNKLTGGGCLAGISGRLVLPYSHFIASMLNNKAMGNTHQALNPIPTTAQFDEEMEMALALSLSTMPYTDLPAYQLANHANDTQDNFSEADLDYVLELSRHIR